MYSQDETVRAVLKFYQQVILHPYLPSSALNLPPTSGWLTISEPNSSKTLTVLSLLRHLPYLRSEKSSERIYVHWETIAINYASDQSAGSFAEDVYPLPDYCIYLTRSVDREGIALILDTNEGIITHMGSGSRIQVPYEEYDALPLEEQWKMYPRIPVKDFFDAWTARYEKLVWMLVPNPIGEPTSGRFIGRASFALEEEELLRNCPAALWQYQPQEGESEAHSEQRKHAAVRPYTFVFGY
jgi:hypothetical protein